DDDRGWGISRKAYYDMDDASASGEDAELEEAEALRLQRKTAAAHADADYLTLGDTAHARLRVEGAARLVANSVRGPRSCAWRARDAQPASRMAASMRP